MLDSSPVANKFRFTLRPCAKTQGEREDETTKLYYMEQAGLIELTGSIDNNTAAAIEARINASLDAVPHALVLDMAGVGFVSSLGLRVMLTAAKRCRKQNAKIAMCSVSVQVVEVFQLSGLSTFFPMHPDRAAALQSFENLTE